MRLAAAVAALLAALAILSYLCERVLLRCLRAFFSARRYHRVATWCIATRFVVELAWTCYLRLCDGIEPLELDAAAGISGLHSLTLHENAWPPLTLRPVVFRGAASDLVAQGRWPSWDDFEPRNWVQWFDNPAVAAKGLPGQRFHYLDTEQRAIVRPAAVPLRLGEVLDIWAAPPTNETLYMQDNGRSADSAQSVFQASLPAHILPRLRVERGFDRIPRSLLGPVDRWQLHVGAHRGRGSTHNDFEDNIFVQLGGRKRWRLYHPLAELDLRPMPELVATRHAAGNYTFRTAQRHGEPCNHNYPQAPHAPSGTESAAIEVTLARGDVMLLPGNWWHAVERLPPAPGAAAGGEFNVAMSLFYDLPWTRPYRDAAFVVKTAGVRGLACAALALASGVRPSRLATYFRNYWRYDERSSGCVRCGDPAAPPAADGSDAQGGERWMRLCISRS